MIKPNSFEKNSRILGFIFIYVIFICKHSTRLLIERLRTLYQREILTDHFEMHIISLPEAIKEYDKNKDDKVLQWMMFLNDPGSVEVAEIMKKNKAIKEANKKLYEISQDEALRRQALNEEIARMDEEQRMYDATQKGLKQGKAEMIKQLASMKIEIKQIAKAANMTEEEVKKILDEKNNIL